MAAERVLVIVAHPDDDVLGFGASAYRLAGTGHPVQAVILCGQVEARKSRPSDEPLASDTMRASEMLGMEPPVLGDFPNIQMNTVPHIDLVQFIEHSIRDFEPTRLFTLHPGDVNDDHRQVSVATQAAMRLPQRDPSLQPIKSLHYMEVLSSTDWSAPPMPMFRADSFLAAGEAGVHAKLSALECYRDVMRSYPHPRSRESVTGLAAVRGSQAGLEYAEAFQTGFVDLESIVG